MTDTPQTAPVKTESAVATAAAVPAAAATAAKPGSAKPGSAMPLTIGIAVVALALGVAGGTLVLGPQLARSKQTAVAGATSATKDAGAGEKKNDKGKEEKPSVYRVENVIVNPAGSEGTHFLMASVAIQVDDARREALLRAHDDQVRDRVISVLERQTLESLSAPGARDTLRGLIARALVPVVGRTDPSHIYLPQFVIQ